MYVNIDECSVIDSKERKPTVPGEPNELSGMMLV